MINVIIADDDEIFRNGLKIIIEQDKDIKVCGLASNGNSAYDLCKTEKPDIVLMDMQMPYCDGSSATYKIKQDFPNIKVLVLTTFDDKATVSKALTSGADGYVLKDVDETKIVNAMKSTMLDINVFGKTVFDSLKENLQTEKPNCLSMWQKDLATKKLLKLCFYRMELCETIFLHFF